VRATRYDEDGGTDGREYCRKIQKPKDVDHTRFKAYLSSDSVLVVEAPVPPSSLNLRKVGLIHRMDGYRPTIPKVRYSAPLFMAA